MSRIRARAALACAAFLAGFSPALAEVRIHDGPTGACVSKGLLQASFDAPPRDPFAGLKGSHEGYIGVAKTNVLEDLKKEAARLGANRIVVRQATSTGTRGFGPRTGPSADWEATRFTAEAFKC